MPTRYLQAQNLSDFTVPIMVQKLSPVQFPRIWLSSCSYRPGHQILPGLSCGGHGRIILVEATTMQVKPPEEEGPAF